MELCVQIDDFAQCHGTPNIYSQYHYHYLPFDILRNTLDYDLRGASCSGRWCDDCVIIVFAARNSNYLIR